jgi:RHS repeat-associated protein
MNKNNSGGGMGRQMRIAIRILTMLGMLTSAIAWPASPQDALRAQLGAPPTTTLGQSATQLSDGRWLLLGGAGSNEARLINSKTGQQTPFNAGMTLARNGHSATLLPDGTVLILGGIGASGAVTAEAERFNPATEAFEPLGSLGLIPRAGHTATVLTDGRLLIIGGADMRGDAIAQAELLELATMRLQSFNARLDTAQINHIAALLPSSDVLVLGGIDGAGRAVPGGELFEATTQRFSAVNAQDAQQLAASLVSAAPPAVIDSSPRADARDVVLNQPLLVRLSKRMDVATLNDATVTLLGPNGTASIRPVAVEGGLLLFATPTQELLPSSRYTLFIQGGADGLGQALPFTAIGFTTQALGAPATSTAAQPSVAPASSATANASAPNTSLTAAERAAAAERVAANADAAGRAAAARAPVDDEDWVPGAQHRKGNWASDRWVLAKQSLPNRASLRRVLHERFGAAPPATFALIRAALDAKVAAAKEAAPAGTTALAGQVLRLNGLPLANVTVQMGPASARTDAQGEFLLSDIPAGNQVLIVDGESANRGNARYGRFNFITKVVPGQTTDLDHIVWMPKLDMRNAVNIPSPTLKETVITNPNIPGLEVVLPAGTVIRDAHGKIVTQVSITPIPVDQTPFPMPFFDVPVYFTLQPGGSVIQGVDGKPRAALLRYPNYGAMGPGHFVKLFDYDPQGRGWYFYGDAKVSSDGQRIISGRDFFIYQFSATSFSNGGASPDVRSPPPDKPKDPCGDNADRGCPGTSNAGDPVDLYTGYFETTQTDLQVKDVVPLVLSRTYRTLDKVGASNIVRPFGIGSSHAHETFLESEPSFAAINLVLPDGTRIRFANVNPGAASYNSDFINTDSPGEFHQAVLHYYLDSVKAKCFYVLYLRDGRRWAFAAIPARLEYTEDRNGNRVSLVRNSGYVTQILGPTGRYINLSYNAGGLISQAADNTGRTVTYGYDTGQRLTTVTNPDGKVRTYTWDTTNNRITSVKDERNNTILTNEYDANGRVFRQTMADASTFTFAYTVVSGAVTKTEVTDRRGSIRRAEFNTAGRIVKDTFPAGITALEQVTNFERDSVTGRVSAVVDPLSRRTEFVYDALGNVTKVTRLALTANTVSTDMTYGTTFSNLLTFKDPNNKITALTYDARGNVTEIKDPLLHTTTFAYDEQGRVTAVTNGLGIMVATLSYTGADLSAVTERVSSAASRTTTFSTDAAGRVTGVGDPLNRISTRTYDVLDRLTRSTQPSGNAVQFTYDPNGNVLTHVDQKGNTTTYTYDALNRAYTRQDALLKTESYAYESGGKLSKTTDRKLQVSGAIYDALGRVATRGFGATTAAPTTFANTITYSWDKGNRMTQTDDSSTKRRTVLRYDGLDRLFEEETYDILAPATPVTLSKLTYTYDPVGRRSGMTVAGQPTVTYTWDDASRLTQIQQAAGASNNNIVRSVGFTYDDADRRKKTVLANGVTADYGYDDASQLVSIVYRKADATLIGDLTYGYDSVGRRVRTSGSMAEIDLPNTVASATHDANNRLTNWNGTTYAYDDNGNLLNDGSLTYTWNSRNQLTSVSGAASGTFAYDAFGRRIGKMVGGVATGYVYDGQNFVQEKNGTASTATPTANLVTGLGFDETFARMTGSGASAVVRHPLADGNNNTVRLRDDAGAYTDIFTYEAYGKTTHTGPDGATQQYTGRENDNTGLYYYRSRYYHPTVGRFISEDPIGWASGQTNNYAYVGGDPVSRTDPLGYAETPPPKPTIRPPVPVGEIPDGQLWSPGPPGQGFPVGEAYPRGSSRIWENVKWPEPSQAPEPSPMPPSWARLLGPIGVGLWAMCRSGNAY